MFKKEKDKGYSIVVVGRKYKKGGKCRCLLLLEKDSLCTVLRHGAWKQTFGGKIY